MARIVVTGASGLVGGELIPRLHGHEVHALARSPGTADLSQARFIPVDLSRPWSTAPLPQQTDVVIHLAQSEHFRDFPGHAADVFAVNTASTAQLLDYAVKAGAKTFILASSGGVYGYGDQGFTEEARVEPRGELGFYLGTKLSSEVLAESFGGLLKMVILRFFFVYGKRQRPGMLIPRLVASVREGRPITLHGEEGIRINPVHVSDAARAIAAALDLPRGEKINVAGPQSLSMRQIGDAIGQAAGIAPRFAVNNDTPPRSLLGNIDKMKRLLGAPEVPFAQGVQELLGS